jgi:hypothetical protein
MVFTRTKLTVPFCRIKKIPKNIFCCQRGKTFDKVSQKERNQLSAVSYQLIKGENPSLAEH